MTIRFWPCLTDKIILKQWNSLIVPFTANLLKMTVFYKIYFSLYGEINYLYLWVQAVINNDVMVDKLIIKDVQVHIIITYFFWVFSLFFVGAFVWWFYFSTWLRIYLGTVYPKRDCQKISEKNLRHPIHDTKPC